MICAPAVSDPTGYQLILAKRAFIISGASVRVMNTLDVAVVKAIA